MTERWKPSVTVAAIVEDATGPVPRFLLVEEHTPEGLKFNNPAGHLDEGESPLQAVVREALEETTRVFTPDRLVGVYLSRFQRLSPPSPSLSRGTEIETTAGEAIGAAVEDVTYLRFAYGGSVGEANPTLRLDDGIVRTLWMTLPELRDSRARHRSALVLQCIEDYTAGRRHPLDTVIADPTLQTPEVKQPR